MSYNNFDKRYYSSNLDKILSKYITEKQYGDLVPVLKEIFQRRAYEFDFSDKYIEFEVKNFIKRAKKIEFISEDKMEESTDMGVYVPNQRKILLNKTYFSHKLRDLDTVELGERMYETLSHEVYHAISDRLTSLGVATMDLLRLDWKGDALNEIITEVAADRSSHSRTRVDFEYGYSKTDGYSGITFVSNLLAASMGVTEKEFLRAGVQNRKELMKLFNSKFPSKTIAETAKKEYFDKIESSLDVIYNLSYKNSGKDNQIDIKNQLRESALTTLYKSAYELALFQISHDNTRTASQKGDEASFRFFKLENIVNDSLDNFMYLYNMSEENYQHIFGGIANARQALENKVLALTGKRSSFELDKYSIYDNSYGQMIMQEDFDNGRIWNNSNISRAMMQEFNKSLDDEKDYYVAGPVAANKRITEIVPIIDEEKMEQVDGMDSRTRITKLVDVAQVRRITEKVETVGSNQRENKRSLVDKFKQTIDIIITRFKNRKLSKLTEGRKDKSEYYANLVNNSDVSKTPEIDKYRVNVNPLRVENITVDRKERKNERNQGEER